jgi:ABC-type lipoprotein release transport system permease subunit
MNGILVRERPKKKDVTDFIAIRHLTSRHNRGFVSFITFIAIIGVTLGVASLDITLAILGGFEKTIKENVVSFTAHMQLFAFESDCEVSGGTGNGAVSFPRGHDTIKFGHRRGPDQRS